MPAGEVELDKVAYAGLQGVWSEDIAAAANCDLVDFGEDAREKGQGGSEVLKLNHFDGM